VGEAPAVESPALTTALKAHTSLVREQKAALSAALDGFVALLCTKSDRASPSVLKVITEDGWNDRANWVDDDWDAWETWAWYRHFCRVVSNSSLRLALSFAY
jgi:nuclear cap-binding protein subunit 1